MDKSNAERLGEVETRLMEIATEMADLLEKGNPAPARFDELFEEQTPLYEEQYELRERLGIQSAA